MNSGGILTVEDRATQEGAKIYISDTGCGMPKDEISKITEAFYRIDKSRSRKQGGVGLGLAICKEIVRSIKERCDLSVSKGKEQL